MGTILVRWQSLKKESRFCATLSAVGCIFVKSPRKFVPAKGTKLVWSPTPRNGLPLAYQYQCALAKCTVRVIKLFLPKCTQPHEDGPCILPHINPYLSMRQGPHPHSPGHFGHGERTWILRETSQGYISSTRLYIRYTYVHTDVYSIRDDVKLARLVRARDCQSRGCRFDSDKNS